MFRLFDAVVNSQSNAMWIADFKITTDLWAIFVVLTSLGLDVVPKATFAQFGSTFFDELKQFIFHRIGHIFPKRVDAGQTQMPKEFGYSHRGATKPTAFTGFDDR